MEKKELTEEMKQAADVCTSTIPRMMKAHKHSVGKFATNLKKLITFFYKCNICVKQSDVGMIAILVNQVKFYVKYPPSTKKFEIWYRHMEAIEPLEKIEIDDQDEKEILKKLIKLVGKYGTEKVPSPISNDSETVYFPSAWLEDEE